MVEVVRIVDGDAADGFPLIEQCFPDGFLRWMFVVPLRIHVGMTAVDFEELGSGCAADVFGREGPIEVRVIHEGDSALCVDVFDRVNEGSANRGVFAAADGSLGAQTIYVHACALDEHRQFFARDDDEVGFFQRFEGLRTCARVVIGQGDEVKTVVAVPNIDVARMAISIAPIAVSVNVSTLERRDIERRVEDASSNFGGGWRCGSGGSSFDRISRRQRASTDEDRRNGDEHDGADRDAHGASCPHHLQQRSLAVHITSVFVA